ncbi:polyphosphate kinase 2 family protein [Propionicimonas sp.]|uniref:polyphosphate kinase 2 family protein n=1 Tax=Propionicimonas sp. TaxID=1955623 RepID=UPI00179DE4A5|nr:polyphosphate kinase 2 family protein [Propionicimonas sp.]MBU3977288.1 polyphosphate kinase 2 family protein [Actinomycetota bacterium]MBA3021213.1 polyphosphate kinase 2 family protein [Propionicimonas sp.]MBU3985798.1 polyphosphate kinase 2 family protein [Actinomycetota bacterium]MBU4008583.1 polyphosphate kinase 2 family protein [Actinomycetota bacterium]MBU4066267.1 polyphosphate kinase 2 family protein [Actinomycetota bacterium]
MSAAKKKNQPLSELLRVAPGPVSLADFDPAATPGYPGKGKQDAPERTAAMATELSELQERLYASGRANPESAPSVLVVLQGMDTSGKGGVVRHAMGLVDPQGVALTSFKAPSAQERKHHYLWRIRRALPSTGMIGVFDRSQYEDVLVVRVESLVPEDVWSKRYEEINRFEQKAAAAGTRIIKCMLNVSFEEQKKRLAARVGDPTKYWKYNPGDVDARAKWPAYMAAYEAALEKCNTETAPWHVIPADRKWYRNWAVAELLRETLSGMDLQWPAADFDVNAEIKRVAAC